MTLPELKVEHLEVRYGDLVGVADISLAVEAGQVVALLGSNGAGKTTTLNTIAGLVRPARGRIEWRGKSIFGEPAFAIVSKGLALSPEGWRLFVSQTVEQNLRLGATALADRARLSALFERVYALFPRLAERRRQAAGTLSGGERQMLALGRALMSEPRLLMLDEPSLGLAPAVVEQLYDTLGALHRQGLTLLLAEQSIPLALGIADYAYVLQTGRIALQGPAAELERDPQVQEIYPRYQHEPRFKAIRRCGDVRLKTGATNEAEQPPIIPYCSHSASRRWRNAFGRSANRRTAMRAARCASCAERSAQAGVSRERQCARI